MRLVGDRSAMPQQGNKNADHGHRGGDADQDGFRSVIETPVTRQPQRTAARYRLQPMFEDSHGAERNERRQIEPATNHCQGTEHQHRPSHDGGRLVQHFLLGLSGTVGAVKSEE